MRVHRVSGKKKQSKLFCHKTHNFVKFLLTLIIFGTFVAKGRFLDLLVN